MCQAFAGEQRFFRWLAEAKRNREAKEKAEREKLIARLTEMVPEEDREGFLRLVNGNK